MIFFFIYSYSSSYFENNDVAPFLLRLINEFCNEDDIILISDQ